MPKPKPSEIKCNGCGCMFLPKKKKSLYCSMKCYFKHRILTESQLYALNSVDMKALNAKSKPYLYVNRENWGAFNKGKVKSEETKNKISQKAKESWRNGDFNKYIERRRKNPIRGKCHFNYKNGSGQIRAKLYHLFEYKDWRNNVFKRDDYTCRECGKRGGELEAHHKTSFREIHKKYNFKDHIEASKCEELFDTDNGVTLCKKCHSIVDKCRKIKKYD